MADVEPAHVYKIARLLRLRHLGLTKRGRQISISWVVFIMVVISIGFGLWLASILLSFFWGALCFTLYEDLLLFATW